MFWDKKEDKKKLPDLPPFKAAFPAMPQRQAPRMEDEVESHALPSFPDSPGHNRFSQAVIKDAVSSDEDEEFGAPVQQTIEEPRQETEIKSPNKATVVEMEDWTPSPSPISEEEFPLPPPPVKQMTIREPPREIPKRPSNIPSEVYIKIDKYKTMRKLLDESRKKLSEIDQLIKNIRETKLREEQELSAWEKEVLQAKSRIEEVSETIFEKVE